MLFLIAGTHFDKRKAASDKLIDTLVTKRPDANQVHFDDQNFSASRFLETIEGAGLFESKNIVVARGVLEDKNHKDVVLNKLQELQDSNNAFVFIENKILKTTSNKFEKVGATVHLFESMVKKQEFNIFALTDLLAQKKKKDLWVKYHEARTKGVADEELHGIFIWQLKALALTYSSTQVASGLKPFVYNKAKTASKNWTEKKVLSAQKKLIKNYHEARRGNLNFSLAMEQFILSL